MEAIVYLEYSRCRSSTKCNVFIVFSHEKAGVRVNNCKFARDSSIPATLFTGEVQQCVEK